MGFGDEIKELEQAATGQGGNEGDNNADNSYVLLPLVSLLRFISVLSQPFPHFLCLL